jgi:hypothetical protein
LWESGARRLVAESGVRTMEVIVVKEEREEAGALG